MAVSREPEFRTVRLREGYDLDAVDDFVDQVIDALDGRSGGKNISPERIESEVFKVVRMREGYSMDDVDDWLDAAATELRKKREKAAHHAPGNTAPGNTAPGTQQHQYPPAVQHAPQTQPADHAWGAANHAGQGPVPGPPTAPPVAPAPPVPQGYPSSTHSDPGYAEQAYPAYGGHPADDPLSDSAVNELDPALRALDPSYGPPVQRTHQQPAVNGYEPSTEDPSLSDVRTPSTGLHHVEIWTRDIDLATRSFGWLFERLGWTLFQVWDSGRSWQSPGGGPYVVIEQSPDLAWNPYNRKAPGLNHLALAVPERWMVDRIVSEAPTYGWRLMFADRHPYAGGPHHYAAYFENDEGFEVEVATP